MCIAALPAVRRKASEKTRRQAYRLKGGYAIPAVGLAICIWLMLQTTRANWIAVGLLLGLGIVLYVLEKRFLGEAE
jgi:amino acid transporter